MRSCAGRALATLKLGLHAAAVLTAAVAPVAGCGPGSVASATEHSGSTGAAVVSASESGTGASGEDIELPEGCGDGIVVPGQYCFRFVPLPLAPGTEPHTKDLAWAVDLDDNGVDEIGFKTQSVDRVQALELFEVVDGQAVKFGQVVDFFGQQLHAWQNLQTDWDGDGRTDLVAVYNGIPTVTAFLQQRKGEFRGTPPRELGDWSQGGPFPFNPTGVGPASLLVGLDAGVQIYRPHGGDSFRAEGVPLEIVNVCRDIYAAREHDVDGDGLLDILALGSNAGCDPYLFGEYDPQLHAMAVLRGRADGGLEPPVYVETGAPARTIMAVDDLDGDGVDDLVLDHDTNVGFSGYSVLLGRPGGTFSSPEVYEYSDLESDSAPLLNALGDFDGDGDVDALFFERRVPIRFVDDVRQPVHMSINWTSRSRPVHAVGDFNGDGIDDLLVVESRHVTSEAWVDSPEFGTGLLLSTP